MTERQADPDILTDLNHIYHRYQRDHAFDDLRHYAKQFVPGTGPLDGNPHAIVVGEAPGADEDVAGIPFVGRSGKFLDNLLGIAGLERKDCWITNVVKYRPPNNRTPDDIELKASIPYLGREIAAVAGSCRLIISLGATAHKATVSGSGWAASLMHHHGHLLDIGNKGFQVYVSYHPSWGLRGTKNRRTMIEDFINLEKILRKRNEEGASLPD